MKFMKRIKDILFDEEEVEIPVIEKESINNIVEDKEDSIKEIKMPEDDFSDKESLKSGLTFPFPIEFDEEELEKTKPIDTFKAKESTRFEREYTRYDIKRDEQPIRKEREIKDYSSYLKTKEEKKQFKPTPIISPVYGVLDQNYKKEDLVLKNEVKNDTSNSKLDIDEIRKKAYGEKLDDTKEIEVIEIEEDIKIDPTKTIGELIEEESINFDNTNNTKDEVIEGLETDIEEEMPKIELNNLISEKENVEKKLTQDYIEDDDETDLFSLIDSMYENDNE